MHNRPFSSRYLSSILLAASVIAVALAVNPLAGSSSSAAIAFPARAQVQPPTPGAQSDPFPRQLTDTSGTLVRIAHPPRRIVSTDWALDEYVYALTDASNVVGVSENAAIQRVSNVSEQFRQYQPIVASDAERVIRARPDLVLTSSQQPATFTALLMAAGIPVFRIDTEFQSIEQIQKTTALVGYLLGAGQQAVLVATHFAETLNHAASRNNGSAPKVLGISGGFTYGANTIFNELVTTLGAVNVAAQAGLIGYDTTSPERIVQWNPDWIVTGADTDKIEVTRRKLFDDPAIAATAAAKQGHILVVDFHTFLPHSPLTANLAEVLSKAFYGE